MPYDPRPWAHLLAPGAGIRSPRAPVGHVPARAEPREVWAPEVVGAVIQALEEAGAGIVQGQMVARLPDGGAYAHPGRADGRPDPFTAVLPDGFGAGWRCTRSGEECWAAWVERSAAEARDAIERLLGVAAQEGLTEPFLDLGWVTADEPALFDIPAYLRDALDRVAVTGDFFASRMAQFEHMRVYWTGPVPGSFYGGAAERVREVPEDARFARVDGRARDIAALAERREIEVLELQYAGEPALRAAAALPRLRHLDISDLRAPTLDALRGNGTIVTLRCSPAGRLRDASGVAGMPALRALFVDVDGVRDLATLAGATQLESLSFTGSLITLVSLAPLAQLTRLRHLRVGHVRVQDGSLRPLHGLSALETIELPDRFSVEELAALSAALPHAAGLPDAPFTSGTVLRQLGCERCRGHDVVETVGKPVRRLCLACDDAKLRRHVLRWELALAGAPSGVAEARAATARRAAEARAREEERLRPRVHYVEADDAPAFARTGWMPVPRIPEPLLPAVPPRPVYVPPPGLGVVVRTFTSLGGVMGAVAEGGLDALFEGGLCEACGTARGPRTDEPVRYRLGSSDARFADGVMIQTQDRRGPTIYLYSTEFVARLTDQERAVLELRPAENVRSGPTEMLELAGSRCHLPLARLRGGSPSQAAPCAGCGWAAPPRYSSVAALPTWLDPEADGTYRGQPSEYVRLDHLPGPAPSCFTIGDWRERASLVIAPERWTGMVRAKKPPRWINGWPVGVVHQEVTQGASSRAGGPPG